MLLGLGIAGPGYASSPSAPTGLSPQGPVTSDTPTFAWRGVTGAQRYQIQVDTDPSFGSTDFDQTTTNTRWVPTTRLKAQDVYWRVRAYNASGNPSSWANASLTVSPVGAPSGLSPDGSVLQQPDDTPLLRWNPVPGASSYVVEVDTDGDWVGATTSTTRTPYYVVPNPQPAGTYYWHVAAVLSNGVQTDWSTPASYQVAPLQDVTFTSPNDNSGTDVEDVALDWQPVPGAKSYELRVSTDQNFGTVVETVTGIVGTRYSPPRTYLNDQYYWQVRAIDRAGVATAWQDAPWNFRRVWPERPTQVYPPDSTAAVGDPFHYQWTPVKHATTYRLEVGTDPNFSPGTYSTCQTAATTYTPAQSDCMPPSQGGVYYWRVRGIDSPAGVEGIYSDVHTFVYDSGAVNLTAPANGATVSVPTFRWQAARNAVQYNVEIRNSSNVVVTSKNTYALSWTPETKLKTTDSPFTWTVQAVDYNGQKSPKYPARTFTLTDPTTASGTPLSPTSGASSTLRAPALSWVPLQGAAYYKVKVSEAAGYVLPDSTAPLTSAHYPYPAATDTSTYFMKPGSYTWWVEAYDASNNLIGTGNQGSFAIENFAPVTGQAVAVDGKTLQAGMGCSRALSPSSTDDVCRGVPTTPVLSWDPVPGAGYYMVYVSKDDMFTNRIYSGEITQNDMWTPNGSRALPDTQAGQAYFWMIRPCKAPGYCAPDPSGATPSAATNAFDKTSAQVQLLSPADDAVETDSEVQFDWSDYYDTNQAGQVPGSSYSETGEHSNQTAMQYIIQVSKKGTSTDFLSGKIDQAVVDQATYTAYRSTYPEGDLYWRVAAIDAAGNQLPWSTIRHLTKTSTPTQLASPSDGAHVPGDTPFQWKSGRLDASYTLEVYKNADTNFSAVNRVISVSNWRQQAYAPYPPLPPSPNAYVWRVRRTDAGGNVGQWSKARSVYSVGGQPTLGQPGNGSWVKPNAAPFTWAPVADALSYRLEIRASGASSDLESVSTQATAWAPTSPLPQGSFQWRVTALDVANQTLGTAPWRSFGVDTVRPTVTSKSPTTTAYRTTNFVARFSERVTNVNSSTMKIYLKGRTTPLKAAVSLSRTGRKATLNPSRNLSVGKYYIIRLSTGIHDRAGNKLIAASWKVRAK